MGKKTALICSVIVISLLAFSELFAYQSEECTVGVAAGKATVDGRPLLWKTRDTRSAKNNEVIYADRDRYAYIAVVTAGSLVAWMGVNEKGFAIMNSQSGDLEGGENGLHNGTIMSYALGHCATVAEFGRLLDSTNVTGRRTTANLGVIDATGAAAIFETDGDEYWKFDANDPAVAPNGYVLRANFAVNGGGEGGIERYHRTSKLVAGYYAENNLSYKAILRDQMRDFVDAENNGLELPFEGQWDENSQFGYINCDKSICRPTSVSAAVFQGILSGESPLLTTMWTILGQPAAGIAVPYWPVGSTPEAADGDMTAPLCDAANAIRALLFDTENNKLIDTFKLRDKKGEGLWAHLFPAEEYIFNATKPLLEKWRKRGPSVEKMLAAEAKFSNYALAKLREAHKILLMEN